MEGLLSALLASLVHFQLREAITAPLALQAKIALALPAHVNHAKMVISTIALGNFADNVGMEPQARS